MQGQRLSQLDGSRAFLVIENWIQYSSSCGGDGSPIWSSGCDVKGWAGWHFSNFPAHGSGPINREQGFYDPFGHNFSRNILHADGHVEAYVVDPGSSASGDPYYSVP